MACGEFGPGRMAEPPAIVEAIEQALTAETPLAGCPAALLSRTGIQTMQTKRLGRSAIYVSKICMGTMTFGGQPLAAANGNVSATVASPMASQAGTGALFPRPMVPRFASYQQRA